MKNYVTQISIEDDESQITVAVVKIFDEVTAEINLIEPVHTAKSWAELSKHIYDAILQIQKNETKTN
jgi:hypothetical protein